MCCQRCVEAVTQELNNLGLKVIAVELGTAKFTDSKKIKQNTIENALNKRGFILVKDEEEILVENIKSSILDVVHHLSDADKKDFSLSVYLEQITKTPYRNLLKVFTKHKGFTIEKYFILQKIEKTKELIEQTKLNFSEIADVLGYKSLQHLSTQFKQITEMTMLKYKKSHAKKRTFIDKL